MAQMSRSLTQYRGGVFSAASPAPRYGSLTSVYENGSLGAEDNGGDLETNASAVLDPALDKLIASLAPAGLETRALQPAALLAASTAVSLAQQARAEIDIQKKLILATAASYSASFFGLPRNALLYTIDQVCGMFAMTAYQRRDFHQQAARLLDSYVASLQKDNSMAGVFQAGASRDGSLGVYRDGILGAAMFQNDSFQDGSLGRAMYQNGAFRGGSLGASKGSEYLAWLQKHNPGGYRRLTMKARAPGAASSPTTNSAVRRTAASGLGCGCSGMGDDAAAPAVEVVKPFYQQPLVIGGAAVALGIVIYAVIRK